MFALNVKRARELTKKSAAKIIKKRVEEIVRDISLHIQLNAERGKTKYSAIYSYDDSYLSVESVEQIVKFYNDLGYKASYELLEPNDYVNYNRYNITIDWSENSD